MVYVQEELCYNQLRWNGVVSQSSRLRAVTLNSRYRPAVSRTRTNCFAFGIVPYGFGDIASAHFSRSQNASSAITPTHMYMFVYKLTTTPKKKKKNSPIYNLMDSTWVQSWRKPVFFARARDSAVERILYINSPSVSFLPCRAFGV